MKDIGGKCTSSVYEGAAEPLTFTCRRRHTFEKSWLDLKDGSWCPECTGEVAVTVEDLQAIAHHRGGRCVSSKYLGFTKRHDFECERGHRWRTTAAQIRKGTWCPRCLSPTPDEGIARVIELARQRGGFCLAPRYHYPGQRLPFACESGHRWRATERDVRRQWCPRCPPGPQAADLSTKSRRLRFCLISEPTRSEIEEKDNHATWAGT